MNIRYTLILVLVAVALGIFAWTQRDVTPVDLAKGTATPTPVALLDLKPDDVQEVEVSGKDGKYTLTRVAGGWEVDGQKASDLVNSVVANLAKPGVLRELSADRKPQDYGFATPSLTVTLKTAGGTSHVIEVGDDTPVETGNVYVRLKDGPKIVVVSKSDITSLNDWFTNKPLAPTATPSPEGTPAAGTPGAAATGGATSVSPPTSPTAAVAKATAPPAAATSDS